MEKDGRYGNGPPSNLFDVCTITFLGEKFFCVCGVCGDIILLVAFFVANQIIPENIS